MRASAIWPLRVHNKILHDFLKHFQFSKSHSANDFLHFQLIYIFFKNNFFFQIYAHALPKKHASIHDVFETMNSRYDVCDAIRGAMRCTPVRVQIFCKRKLQLTQSAQTRLQAQYKVEAATRTAAARIICNKRRNSNKSKNKRNMSSV